MGKRISISQPTVIQTELRPLSESFWIDANGQLEQWYYQNTGVFSPDRQITALRLSPMLSLLDQDTNTSYSSSADPQSASYVDFQNVVWKVKEWNGSTWVETTITSVSTGDPFYTDGDDLIIRKNNYDAAHAINITCRGNYRDPRDIGTTCWIEATTMLVTNMDATQVYPTIDIKNPSARMFNPLKDDPIYEFEAEANWDVLEGQGGTDITEYKVDALGTEKILPANEDMLVNAAPLLDIKYGDTALSQQQFMDRQVSGGVVSDIPDGLAKIDNIKGNTVKFIQSFNNSRLSTTYSSITPTITTVSNGVRVVITGATGESKYFNLNLFLNSNELGLKTGHKYYICDRKNDSRFQLVLGFGNSSIVITGNASIVSPSYNGTDNTFFRYNTSISGNADVVLQPQIFDLTDMGIANLTTVNEVEDWLAANVGLKSYYPYTEGQLINYGGYQVKWNQLLNAVPESKSQYGITLVNNGDNSLTLSGTATDTFISSQLSDQIVGNGHVYYFWCQHFQIRKDGSTLYADSGGYRFATVSGSSYIWRIRVETGSKITEETFYPKLIDLTLMFGAGNEPDLDWCNRYLSRDYYEYCEGQDKNILDVAEVKTAGFNKWDEEWELGHYDSETGAFVSDNYQIASKNFVKVFENTTYYGKTPSTGAWRALFYSSDKNFIGSTQLSGSSAFTTPPNAAFMSLNFGTTYGSTYNHDICINLSDPSRNGTYEPYKAQYEKLPMGVKSVGFNIWDEEWENGYYDDNGNKVPSDTTIRSKNAIPVYPSTEYYVPASVGKARIMAYTADGTVIGRLAASDGKIQTPSNCRFIRFNLAYNSGATYNHDICINLYDPSRNGTYEAHWESFSDMSWITKIGIENFNIWDEEWEVGGFSTRDGGKDTETGKIRSKNYIQVSPSTKYYKGSRLAVFYYDSNKGYISSYTETNSEFTTPASCKYIMFTTLSSVNYGDVYKNDICINESIPAYNGKYLPHGQTMPYFPNGLCHNGSVYDEVKVENGKIKGVVRIGSVDLGSFSYNVVQWNGATSFTPVGFNGISDYRAPANTNTVVNAICPSFVATTRNINYENTAKLPLMSAVDTGFQIRHPTIETESAFITAMSGVRLYYELFTPYEFEIDYPTKGQFEWYGIDGSGNEVPIDTLPVYSQAEQPSGYGQHSSKIRINALYALSIPTKKSDGGVITTVMSDESIPVILRVKRYPWSAAVLPPKVVKAVTWKTPPLDVIVTSNKGSAVRSQHLVSPTDFTFEAIVNQQGEVISEEKKQENLVFKWYYVKYDSNGQAATPVLAGTGLSVQISTNTLKNSTPQLEGAVKQSTNVYCEVYLLGAYHLVNGTYVRSIE